jgi:hypothetical protein
MPTLVMANKNYSSWSVRPWFFLRAVGILFEEKVVGSAPFADGGQSVAFGRLPACADDGGPYDSCRRRAPGGAVPDKVLARRCKARRARAPRAPMPPALATCASAHLQRATVFTGDVARSASAEGQWPPSKRTSRACMPFWTELVEAAAGPLVGLRLRRCLLRTRISRFKTYGIESSGAASSYRSTVLAPLTYNHGSTRLAELSTQQVRRLA